MTNDPTPVTIRAAVVGDAEAMLACWRDADAAPSVTDSIDHVRRAIAGSACFALVAEANARMVGTVIAAFDGWRAHIYRLAVLPELRRRGVARALVAAVDEELGRRGAVRVMAIVTHSRPSAMGFWRATGYRHDPDNVRFIRDLS